ncbi:E3 ubiquitin-protein ligase TRIM39-like [Protobothrops mucrosquamatus]|uniref:E3 ubiquitin-protein ligase TRIM39-like n=1 Tax=Protobothrops mucrosquamatus TaxID=103944 RepID=UPI0010FB5168|nr:E3 ubiquitin-protein ligase TRIM39-like [Protobothrops mucrosquamatus]
MATAASMQDLLEEATCSICLEYFQDPVLIPECGHNFCRGCLTRSWGTSESEASCPQCRQTFGPRNVLPNRQLARVLEMARRYGGPWGEDGGSLCPKHREPLKLFCKHHETLICVVCNLSQEHRGHLVIPAEEAFQEYQIKVGDWLKAQKEEKEKIATYKTDTEQRVQEMLDHIEKEKKNVVAEFRELQLWLEGQEKLILARMEETEKKIMAIKEKFLAKHMEELCSLDDLIQEIEEKHQQPASKLLTDTLESGLQLQEVEVILDPYIDHPRHVCIPEDGKSVRVFKTRKQIYPFLNSRIFEGCPYVLGCQTFSTGRHFWEVTVRNTKGWRVGITDKALNVRHLDEHASHWQVYKWEKKYGTYSPSVRSELVLTEELTRIRISLNCEGGQVSFFDARTAALLCTFSDTSLVGETLLPCFFLRDDALMTLP